MLRSPIASAGFVFAFLAFVTVQHATGFLYEAGLQPRAAVAIDSLIDMALVGPLGESGALTAMILLTLFLPVLVYVRGTSAA